VGIRRAGVVTCKSPKLWNRILITARWRLAATLHCRRYLDLHRLNWLLANIKARYGTVHGIVANVNFERVPDRLGEVEKNVTLLWLHRFIDVDAQVLLAKLWLAWLAVAFCIALRCSAKTELKRLVATPSSITAPNFTAEDRGLKNSQKIAWQSLVAKRKELWNALFCNVQVLHTNYATQQTFSAKHERLVVENLRLAQGFPTWCAFAYLKGYI